MDTPWQIETVDITVSKHFALKYMRKWNWDFHDVRDALRHAYEIKKVSQHKYEIYINKKSYKKIITIYYHPEQKLFCITGSDGGTRQ